MTRSGVLRQAVRRFAALLFLVLAAGCGDNEVFVFADEERARAAYERISVVGTVACHGERLARGVARGGGLDVAEPKAARVSFDAPGDERDAARTAVRATARDDGQKVTSFLEFVIVRVNRALSITVLATFDTPVEEALRERVAAAPARRLADAL